MSQEVSTAERTDGFLVMPCGTIAHYFLPGKTTSLCGARKSRGCKPWESGGRWKDGKTNHNPSSPVCEDCKEANDARWCGRSI